MGPGIAAGFFSCSWPAGWGRRRAVPGLSGFAQPPLVCRRKLRLMAYIELHARSAFSFLEGASLPEALISAGAQWGMPAMALLDRDGVYGAPRFHAAAKKLGMQAHIGAEVTVEENGRLWRLPLLA